MPRNDRQGTPINTAGFIWFTDDSYLKDATGPYQAGCAIISFTDVTESCSLPTAKAVQAELIALRTQPGQLASDTIANIYTDSR